MTKQRTFNGVKVFFATMIAQRQVLGETVTAWLKEAQARPNFQLVDIDIRQSSDQAYHCISIILWFNEDSGTENKRRG